MALEYANKFPDNIKNLIFVAGSYQIPVNKIDDLKAVIKKSDKKKGVLLLVNRQGNIIFVALKVKD